MGQIEPTNQIREPAPQRGMTRRRFLQVLCAGGAALTGGLALSACGAARPQASATSSSKASPTSAPKPPPSAHATSAPTVRATGAPTTASGPVVAPTAKPTRAPRVDVTLKVTNDYIYAMPTKQQQKADPNARAQAEVLGAWLDLNPGVKIQYVKFDIWTPQTIQAALAGGTEPSVYSPEAMGGYNLAGEKAAFVRGWAADVTDLMSRYKVLDSLASYVRTALEPYKTNGKWYLYPWFFEVGTGMYYRRDWIRQRGLEEPRPGWTYDDFRRLAKELTFDKHKGFAAQGPTLEYMLGDYGWSWLVQIPAPDTSWHWRWDYTSLAPRWTKVVDKYRAMIYKDDSVLSDITFSDDQVIGAFMHDQAAMMSVNTGFYTEPPGAPEGMSTLAERVGKPLEEVVGFVPGPVAFPGQPPTPNPYNSSVAFSPDIGRTAVEKAFNLVYWLSLGPGPAMYAKQIWASTHNLKYVYGNPLPLNGKTRYEGIPGSAEDAWGKQFIQTLMTFANRPLVPDLGEYLPPEKNTGPATTAVDDATSKWTFERKAPDVPADLKKLQDTLNTQAAGFTSSIPKDTFVAGARKYYQAQRDFWQKRAPEFYATVYRQWYEKKIVPVLG